jgi:NADH-quinone oxidoreductase subunit A
MLNHPFYQYNDQGDFFTRGADFFFLVSLLFFFFLVFFLGLFLFLISYCFVYQRKYAEKVSPYECGFQPYSDACINFEVRYFLLAVLFLIFDVEVIFLFPFCAGILAVGLFEFSIMFLFNILLLSTLIFEIYYNVFSFQFLV